MIALPEAGVPPADLRLEVRRRFHQGQRVLSVALAAADGSLDPASAAFEVALETSFEQRIRDLEVELGHIFDLGAAGGESLVIARYRLAAVGLRLFHLLPSGLRELLWRAQGKVRTLHIVSDEAWLPWELVKLEGPPHLKKREGQFLGEVFAVARWLPGVDPVLLLPAEEMAVVALPTKDARGNLPEVPAEAADRLERTGPARSATVVPALWSDITRELATGRFDAWHFAGHGPRQRSDPDRRGLALGGEMEITPEDLAALGGLGDRRPLVVWNGCATARGGLGFADLGGWPARWLEAGAGAYLGTLWDVPDRLARSFANAFYERLFSGVPIGEAVRGARLFVRKKFHGHPAWLAWALYAHPAAAARSEVAGTEPAPRARPVRGEPLVSWHRYSGKAWSEVKESSRLSGEIGAMADPEAFRHLAQDLLAIAFAPPRMPIELGVFAPPRDDIAVYHGPGGERGAMVFTMFAERAEDLGAAQAERCGELVERFLRSPLAAQPPDFFLLLVNRDGRQPDFRQPVLAALAGLEKSGTARRAELWDPRELLRRTFTAVLNLLILAAESGELSGPPEAAARGGEDPIEQVPLRRATLRLDQHQLLAEEGERQEVADPAVAVLTSGAEQRTLLLGEFGFGKTTALARTFRQRERRILYLPGAAISSSAVGTKDLLAHCLNLDHLGRRLGERERELFARLARPALERLLKEPDLPVALLLDGLDESAHLGRAGGFQHLANAIHQIRVPVVFAMRTEFWNRRRSTFESEFGRPAGHGERRRTRFQVIELVTWEESQVAEFLRRYREACSSDPRRRRIAELEATVPSGDFERLFGDIPKRPLFLRFLADAVAEHGMPGKRVGRARLLRDWAEIKIRRDLREPKRRSPEGRGSLVDPNETEETVVGLAWEAMLAAARAMVEVADGALELVPSCDLEDVLSASRRLERIAEPLRLFLFSLLRPGFARLGAGDTRVSFAHRAYQEYFLAWSLLETGVAVGEVVLPDPVVAWIRDLEREGLIA